MKMGMKGIWAIPVIFGIALMMTLSVLPAMANHGGNIGICFQADFVWDPNSGQCIFIGDCPNGVSTDGAANHCTLIISGTIISINPADKHGVIMRTDDGSNNQYQFTIPRDLTSSGYNPTIGDQVGFDTDPENTRHATNVFCITPCDSGK